jgi:hypothetical protein
LQDELRRGSELCKMNLRHPRELLDRRRTALLATSCRLL